MAESGRNEPNMEMIYYKRVWDESRGDNYDSWGRSVWYFEVCKLSGITREQIEIYANGQALFYDEDTNTFDKYGGLAEIPFIIEEYEPYEISKIDYENIKNRTKFINSK